MTYKRDSFAILVIVILGLWAFPAFAPQQTSAKFVLAAWDYPDSYGNGIEYVYYQLRYENDTIYEWGNLYYYNSTTLEIGENHTLFLKAYCWLNGTQYDISSYGFGYFRTRARISVTYGGATEIYSSNFSRDGGSQASAPMYQYRHSDTILFGFVAGVTYIGILTFEVYL